MAIRKSRPPSHKRLRIYIISAALGAAASAASLILFSLIVFLLKIPVADSRFLSFLSFGIGCLVSGFSAGAMKRQDGLGAGIKAALLFALPVAMIGFVLSGFTASEAVAAAEEAVLTATRSTGLGTFNKAVTAVLCGAIGGVIGVNKNGGF